MIVIGGLGPDDIAAVLGIFLIGGLIKGVLGFGLPLITMSLLPFVVPIDMALALSGMVQPFTNFQQLGGLRTARRMGARFWPVLVALPPGVAIGAYVLSAIRPEHLLAILGVAVMSFVSVTALGVRVPIPARWAREIAMATGFLAGIVGALTAANGPVFIVYLVSRAVGRAVFRAGIALMFLVSSVCLLTGFASVGVLSWERAGLGLVCLAPSFLGMHLGNRVGRRLGAGPFRWAVLGCLFVIGLRLCIKGLS